MYEVFVSYRRRDSSLFVDLLAEHLQGVCRVFVDTADIELGETFMSTIQQAISRARLVIVIIGSNWNPSRLHDEADVVAYELRTAKRFARRVIPLVLLPGTMPGLDALPSDLGLTQK
jgi:TIR domain